MSFSQRLAKLQADRFETDYRLAKEIGAHQTTIKNWKSGVKPQLAHLAKLAEHYGCTVDELLGEDT